MTRFTGRCYAYVARRKNSCSACGNTIIKGDSVYKAEVEGRLNPRYENNEECSVIICKKCGEKMRQGKWVSRTY